MEGLLDPADPDAADPELDMTVAGRAMWYRLMLLPGNEKGCVITIIGDRIYVKYAVQKSEISI